ncbi:MAG: sigma-54 dependent transcriptional regulator [Bacteroidota bacterium]
MERMEFQKQMGIIGESVEIKEILDVVLQVAPTDITVLISGESGTGKELIAKAIHAASPRVSKTLVTVNCGAIPEGIMESELFGHEKGAFTGATELRKGYFEIADGGTIFLDEIGEMPLATQVKFLRVLENGEFMRVGASTPRKANVRVIAATNKDLEQEVRNGNFREDLFYRLRSVNIRVPPLRDRREDIPLFFNAFVRDFCERNNLTFAGITDEAMQLIVNHDWPGNIRELKNVVESMLVIERGKRLEPEDVRKHLRGNRENHEERNLPVFLNRTAEQAERELLYRALVEMRKDILEVKNLIAHQLMHQAPVTPPTEYSVEANVQEAEESMALDEVERKMIINALDRFHGNRRLAARALRISERTLYRKIKEYGLPK